MAVHIWIIELATAPFLAQVMSCLLRRYSPLLTLYISHDDDHLCPFMRDTTNQMSIAVLSFVSVPLYIALYLATPFFSAHNMCVFVCSCVYGTLQKVRHIEHDTYFLLYPDSCEPNQRHALCRTHAIWKKPPLRFCLAAFDHDHLPHRIT